MRAAMDPGLMATDLADYLVAHGLPFRQAHALAGKAVAFASSQSNAAGRAQPGRIPAPWTRKSTRSLFDDQLYAAFDPLNSVARRRAAGGTAPEALQRADPPGARRSGETQLSSNRSSRLLDRSQGKNFLASTAKHKVCEEAPNQDGRLSLFILIGKQGDLIQLARDSPVARIRVNRFAFPE